MPGVSEAGACLGCFAVLRVLCKTQPASETRAGFMPIAEGSAAPILSAPARLETLRQMVVLRLHSSRHWLSGELQSTTGPRLIHFSLLQYLEVRCDGGASLVSLDIEPRAPFMGPRGRCHFRLPQPVPTREPGLLMLPGEPLGSLNWRHPLRYTRGIIFKLCRWLSSRFHETRSLFSHLPSYKTRHSSIPFCTSQSWLQ